MLARFARLFGGSSHLKTDFLMKSSIRNFGTSFNPNPPVVGIFNAGESYAFREKKNSHIEDLQDSISLLRRLDDKVAYNRAIAFHTQLECCKTEADLTRIVNKSEFKSLVDGSAHHEPAS